MMTEKQFDDLRQRVKNDPKLRWERVRADLDGLGAYVSNSDQDDYEAFKQEIYGLRREHFEKHYQEVEGMIAADLSLDADKINERLAQLKMMGEPDNVETRVEGLRVQWRAYEAARQIGRRLDGAIEDYQRAVTIEKMALDDAVRLYLDPIQTEIERNFQIHGQNHPALMRQSLRLKEIRRQADDRVALSTMAVQGEYEKIIDQLRLRSDDYEQELFDESNVSYGTRKKAEALDWYEQRAEEFAKKKAASYREEAEAFLNAGRPVAADITLRAARSLFRITPADLETVTKLYNERVLPIIQRIDNARQKLNAIPNTGALLDAMTYYADALNPDKGWPAFESIDDDVQTGENTVQKVSGKPSGGTQTTSSAQQGGLVARARNHIYALIEVELDGWVHVQGQLVGGHRVYYALNQRTAEDAPPPDVFLEACLAWGDGRFRRSHGFAIQQLITDYRRQRDQVKALQTAVNDARLRSTSPRDVYMMMASFEKLLEVESEQYPEAHRLWISARAFQEIDKIREHVSATYQSGYNPGLLDTEIIRINRVVQEAETACATQAQKAQESGLVEALRDLKGLQSLLNGLQLRAAGRYSEAIQAFDGVSQGNMYYTEARRQREEVSGQVRDSGELDRALVEAKSHIEAERYEQAYNALKPHNDKIHAARYTDLIHLMNIIKPILAEQLRQQIELNMTSLPTDPRDLERLYRLYREVVPVDAERLGAQVDRVLALQKAVKTHREASQKDSDWRAWERAVRDWEKTDAPDYTVERRQAHEMYVLLRVNHELNGPISNLDKARRLSLDTLMNEIGELLRAYPGSTYVTLLRARVMAAQIMIEDEVFNLENLVRNARAEILSIKDTEARNEYFEKVSQTIEFGEKLVKTARDLEQGMILAQSYDTWRATRNAWDVLIIMPVASRFIGIRAWYERFTATVREKAMEAANQAPTTWEKIVPLAKASVVSRGELGQNIDDLWEAFQLAAQAALQDPTGHYAGEEDEQKYLARLTETADAMVGLFSVTDKEYALQEAEAILRRLRKKVLEIDLVIRMAGKLTGRINNIKASGDFSTVDSDLAVILGEDAHPDYRQYQRHRRLAELLKDIQQSKEKRGEIVIIADQAKQAADFEYFEQAIGLYQRLQMPEYSIYNAETFASYTDPRSGTYTVVDDITEVLENKRAQTVMMFKVLEPIIDLDKLKACLRPTPNQPIKPDEVEADIVETNIVNIERRWVAGVAPLANRGDFPEALRVAQLLYGRFSSNDPEAPYEEVEMIEDGLYSLYGGQVCVRRLAALFPPQEGRQREDQFQSDTALAIWRWAGALNKVLRAQAKTIEEWIAELRQIESAYETERSRFYVAYNVLMGRAAGDRRRNADVLEEAYKRLKVGDEQNPALTPASTEFDRYYQDAINRRR